MVKSNPKLDWNVRALAMCESISIRDLIDHFDANSIEPTAVMKELSKRHDLDLQTILEYCHLPWVFYPGETGKWFRELMGISS